MLEINDLNITIGPNEIVSIERLSIPAGRRLGLVGESGSGKTMTAMSIIGLQPREAVVTGSITFAGTEMVDRSERDLSDVRGAEIGVIFQDPLRALNPTMKVGKQVAEALRLHNTVPRKDVKARTLELLEQVQLPNPAALARRYPHQLSGGQQQRVLISMAIACDPKLLIADEPTTALDVTVQKEILELLARLSEERGMAILFVSHDLGVIQAISDYIAVLYGGNLVETGPTSDIVELPRHRYTEALISVNPGHPEDISASLGEPLVTIRGSVPPSGGFLPGCRFRGRCPHEIEQCAQAPPISEMAGGHTFKCWNPVDEAAPALAHSAELADGRR
ncbi:ABC transporter ATP-binding protein [Candidatus Poriferisodalis sp.]|uniref:ABC transporter ATP-binding protein n=1 Tax=Candidatus Poriferisodalis sp. TaxID=3101277 RepID=UPI003B515877